MKCAIGAEYPSLTNQPSTWQIHFLKPDGALLPGELLGEGTQIAQIIRAVAVKKQRGIDAFRALNDDGIRPRARRVLGGNIKVDIAVIGRILNKGRGDIEQAVLFAITDGGSIDAFGGLDVVEIQLLRTGEAVTDLMPVDKVAGMKDRDARKILKGRSNQIVVLAFAADRWIRIETRKQGIGENLHRGASAG